MSKFKALITLAILFCGCDDVPQTAPAAPVTSQAVTTSTVTLVETSQSDNAPRANSEPPAAGTDYIAKTIGILDGDTIEVLTAEKKTIRVRLNGIDAPDAAIHTNRLRTTTLRLPAHHGDGRLWHLQSVPSSVL